MFFMSLVRAARLAGIVVPRSHHCPARPGAGRLPGGGEMIEVRGQAENVLFNQLVE